MGKKKYIINQTWIMNDIHDIKKVADIRSEIGSYVADEKKMVTELIFEEIFVNIVKYSECEKEGCAVVTVVFETEADRFEDYRLTFKDRGKPFDPTKHIVTGTGQSIGGHGIELVRALSKKMEYKRNEDTNILEVLI